MTISPHNKGPLRSTQKAKDRSVSFSTSIKVNDQAFNMRTDKHAGTFRIVLLGEDGVGKSAISVRFLCGRYLHEYDPTLESCYEKSETVYGRTTKIEMFDTANQAPLAHYLQDADALLYVYSITDRASFEQAQRFGALLRLHGKSHLPVMLVGNKREMGRGRRVSFKEGYILARDAGWTFREVSAATDNGKLKDGILDFIGEVQTEAAKKMKASRKGRYFRRAVSALSGSHNNNNNTHTSSSSSSSLSTSSSSLSSSSSPKQASKEDSLSALSDWTLSLLHLGPVNNQKIYQRRMTLPNLIPH